MPLCYPPMSEHSNVETIYAYLDGELTQQEAFALEAHLRTCPECAGELEHQRSLFRSIESLPSVPLGTNLAPGVMAAIRPRRDWLQSLVLGELLAAASLTTALVLWLGGAELQLRLGDAAQRIVGQLGTASANMSTILSDLLSQRPAVPQHDLAELGELLGSALISPSILWLGAAALALWLLGNGLVLRRVRQEG